jgi:hypothetical protein
MEWTLQISYGTKHYELKAELEYHSNQVMRIRVHGKTTSLLLENNYPLQLIAKKRTIQWKIKEGKMNKGTDKTSRLLLEIIRQLEYLIKKEFPKTF